MRAAGLPSTGLSVAVWGAAEVTADVRATVAATRAMIDRAVHAGDGDPVGEREYGPIELLLIVGFDAAGSEAGRALAVEYGARVVGTCAAEDLGAVHVACAAAAGGSVVAVRAGTMLCDGALVGAARIEQLSTGTADPPTPCDHPADVLAIPAGVLRTRIDPRLRGEIEAVDAQRALGDPPRDAALRYTRLQPCGVAYRRTDWAARIANALVVDRETPIPDDLVVPAMAALDELASPWHWFDLVVCINRGGDRDRWEDMLARARLLGMARRFDRCAAVEHAISGAAGALLSHRRVIADAAARRAEHVLILEDDVVFRRGVSALLAEAVARLDAHRWDVCYLGFDVPEAIPLGDDPLAVLDGPLRRIDVPVANFHAQVVHRRAFDTLLEVLPATPDGALAVCEQWVATSGLLRELYRRGTLNAIAVWPRLAAQADQLSDRRSALDPAERAEFVI